MENKEFINKLINYKFANPIYEYVIKEILQPSVDDELLKIFSIYFVFVSNGSSCMPLDYKRLSMEWKNKCVGNYILLSSEVDNEEEKKHIEEEIKSLYECGSKAMEYVPKLYSLNDIVGDHKLFFIHENYLYARKYFLAKEGIKRSINRLFVEYKNDINIDFDVKTIWKTVSKEQEEFIKKGISTNLILCGGPGTGKTTAVFYLLLELLKIYKDYSIYLTAPSGKASSRIKESIDEEIEKFKINNSSISEYDSEIEKLAKVNRYTIHKLLENDYTTNDFSHNENNLFSPKSIFIIDEASMIDICIFDSLLRAISQGARVFILGDKHQLPSVECGSVLSDLLSYSPIKKNIIELIKSHRFVEGSDIYNLSMNVNNGTTLSNVEFKSLDEFNIVTKLQPPESETKEEALLRKKNSYPVFFYEEKEDCLKTFQDIVEEWGEHFYKDNEEKCGNIPFIEEKLDVAYENIDEARILCAENLGTLGIESINSIIKNKVIKNTSNMIKNYSVGIPLMITENNKALDLDNGDTGIIITLEGSDIPYFLIAKASNLHPVDAKRVEDKILKVGKYLLYPLRMLDLKKTVLAYAITIHKSQGSGYDNILIVLPKKKGHPLLNRQIVYTAITRTKGPTYIISSIDRINEAIENITYRYTQIFD